MPIKAVLDSLDGLSDEMKPHYVEITEGDNVGKFMLAVEPVSGFSLEDVTGLKNSLTASKADLDTAKKALEGYKGLPAPKDLAVKLKKLDKLEKFDPESEADKLAAERIQAKIDALDTKHGDEMKAKDSRNAVLTSEVERLLIDSEAKDACIQAKGDPDLLLPFIKPRLKIVEEDGKFIVQVTKPNGEQEYSIRDNKAVSATVADLIAQFKVNPKFGALFEGSGQSGGGAQGGNRKGGPTGPNPFVKETFNLTEQMLVTKRDPVLAAALKQQAGA